MWAAEAPAALRAGTPRASWLPGVLGLVLAGAGGGIWWGLLRLRGGNPDEVDLDE